MEKATRIVSSAVQEYLSSVQKTVNRITDPNTGAPVQIPDFPALYEAAGKLDSTPHPEDAMCVIQTLLGRASSVGSDAPDASYKVSFPQDHHLHANMGLEWYWVGCHMNVTDQNGNTGRLSVLLAMEKIRSVGLEAQQAAGWTDREVTLASNSVTLTVDMGPGNRNIYRRNRNLQWPLKNGVVNFSTPGQDFHFQCGADSLSGSADVLPLSILVSDGDNMNIDITLSNQATINLDTSFFLQGIPIIGGSGGTGTTPIPTPGIYYSWPQLQVSGSVSVRGNTYTVASGSGWIDHQLMMNSLQNPPTQEDPQGIHPVPFVEDPAPYNGWTWQFHNLDNGQAFTGAAFIQGEMNYSPSMSYGYFLTPVDSAWEAIFINGNNELLCPKSFPAIIGQAPRGNTEVDIPLIRAYGNVENIIFGDPLCGVATPWYSDGTFNNPNWSLCAEFPADYTDMSGKYANGLGYMETVGFESVAAYRAFALDFLKKGTLPSCRPKSLPGTLAVVPPGFTTDLAPWEDGLRSIVGPGSFEWWYFDAILFDQSGRKFTCVVIFFTNRPFQWTGEVTPLVLFSVGKPDGTFVQVSAEFKPGDFSQPPLPAGLDLKIGPNSARGGLGEITIYAEGIGQVFDQSLQQIGQETITARLTLSGLLPAFRLGPPSLTPPQFLAEQIIMPSGKACGQLTCGASTHKVSGDCYHDHQWGPCLPALSGTGEIAAMIAANAASSAYAAATAYARASGAIATQEIVTAIAEKLGGDDPAVTAARNVVEAAIAASAAAELTTGLALTTVQDIVDAASAGQSGTAQAVANPDTAPYWYWGHFTAGEYAGVFALVFKQGKQFSPQDSCLIMGKGQNILTAYQASESLQMILPKEKDGGSWVLEWREDAHNLISATFTETGFIARNSTGYRRYSACLALAGRINGETIDETGDVLWEYFPIS